MYCQFSANVLQKPPMLPIHCIDLLYFIAHLCNQALSAATITGYVSALSSLHKMNNLADPAATAIVQKTLQGVRKSGTGGDIRLPITPRLLSLMYERASMALGNNYDVLLVRAVILTAFHGFFRLGELVVKGDAHKVVQLSGVRYTEGGAELTLPSSKTTSGPVKVSVACEASAPCPVAAIKAFVQVRGRMPGPLFAHPDGSAYLHNQFHTRLVAVLSVCGLDPGFYKGHSFRIGAASEAARRGYSDAQIRLMGRWKSDAFRVYIRAPFSLC